MLRRNYTPTPLGYAILTFFALIALYFLTPADTSISLLPSSWSSQSDTWATPHEPIGEEEDELDNRPLPLLPEIYSSEFPDLKLPASLLASPKLYPLTSRLVTFLSRPILSHSAASPANLEGCPSELSDKLVNPDQYAGDGPFWRDDVDEAEIVRRRADVVRYLSEAVEKGEQVLGQEGKTGKGRGIVLTGGNQDTTLRTITAIKHLRRLGVKLPIEVFHYSDELHNKQQRKEIESLGATLREAKGLEKVAGVWKNWQIKGLALVQSSFREIIYLDSDNTPLRSPSHLFDAPIYTSSGRAAFWPDLSKDHPDNAIWRLVGETCSLDLWTFESGQIVVDKAGNEGMNLAALIIAAGMMRDRDFWFHMCGGDKDTFRWAWRMLDIEFGVSPRWMSTVGIRNEFQNGRFCGHSVLQYDLATPVGFSRPPPLFVHSNLLKHLGGAGLSKGKLFKFIRRMSEDYSSSPALNHAHSFVYDGIARGMCLDLDWHEDTPQEVKEDVRVETYAVGQEEGGVFDGFEDAWWEEGGRVGGW
ncbi:hypothetical protein CNBB5500 [Cryptococcus deneoformans B-3501A]|uniref:Expressed protein n=1 Tax=Cryptococcus deneoformans (strain JEC21 / ATCC MYA-565) TaxID=214684 RepID=Q5KMX4_CRYD1|nr:expressed protein [Cryptococcus neoformans var. neoformans JEC21]XP_777024.1 hypothetical protein CNBB5500 [Cryptococcus neoformans var. neoformans B-3501A]AAW41452.1 expressed protein [Cryptococcus neoformans var. neoformans JEC21]EAL22377.1 hypothetical protein CNBB5500 [Cryptococcus neoformans var. neoformans B-3501A]